MPRVGFEPTIPVFELAKTDRAATVIGTGRWTKSKYAVIPTLPFNLKVFNAAKADILSISSSSLLLDERTVISLP
jgi:hypothetical protein